MNRSRFPVLSIVSAALLVTVAVLLARSRRHADVLGLFPPSGHLQAVGSDRGGLIFFASNIPWGREYSLSADTLSLPRDEVKDLHDELFDPARKKWSLLGFHFAHGDLTPLLPSTYSALTVPYWFLLIVLGFLPALATRGTWRRWRRRRMGLCPHCGYDTRESKERCPECGQPILANGPRRRGGISPGSAATVFLSFGLIGISVAVVRALNGDRATAITALDRIVPDLDLHEASLLGTVYRIESDMHLALNVDWKSLREADIDKAEKLDIHFHRLPLRRVLDLLFRQANGERRSVVYCLDGSRIMIRHDSAMPVVARIYDLRAIQSAWDSYDNGFAAAQTDDYQVTVAGPLFQNLPPQSSGPTAAEKADAIDRLLDDLIAPDTWRDNGGAQGLSMSGSTAILVAHTERRQKQVRELFDGMRRAVSAE